jgi:hypothetical protein
VTLLMPDNQSSILSNGQGLDLQTGFIQDYLKRREAARAGSIVTGGLSRWTVVVQDLYHRRAAALVIKYCILSPGIQVD